MALHAINPGIRIDIHAQRADADLLDRLVPQANVVLDCTDNFDIRQLINARCVRHQTPLVEGSAIRFAGQVAVFDMAQADSACYACLFPPEQEVAPLVCATMGVFAPLVGLIGTVQAAEALKLLCGIGKPLVGRLLMLDSRRMEWTEVRVQRQPDCQVCSTRPKV